MVWNTLYSVGELSGFPNSILFNMNCEKCKGTGIIRGGDLGLDWSTWCNCSVGKAAADRLKEQIDRILGEALQFRQTSISFTPWVLNT